MNLLLLHNQHLLRISLSFICEFIEVPPLNSPAKWSSDYCKSFINPSKSTKTVVNSIIYMIYWFIDRIHWNYVCDCFSQLYSYPLSPFEAQHLWKSCAYGERRLDSSPSSPSSPIEWNDDEVLFQNSFSWRTYKSNHKKRSSLCKKFLLVDYPDSIPCSFSWCCWCYL